MTEIVSQRINLEKLEAEYDDYFENELNINGITSKFKASREQNQENVVKSWIKESADNFEKQFTEVQESKIIEISKF